MDALDVEILASLALKPYPGRVEPALLRPWDVARRLGLHGNTVKKRIEELRAAGILRGLSNIPSPRALGFESAVYAFRWDSIRAKREGVAILVDSGTTNDVIDFIGTEAWVGILSPRTDSLVSRAKLLARASRAAEHELLYEREGGSRRPREFSRIDLRILEELVDDAHRPLAEVAECVGVTPRTVRARHAALVADGSLIVIPVISVGDIVGRVPVTLRVRFVPGTERGRVHAILRGVDSRYTHKFDESSGHAHVHAMPATTRAAEDACMRLLDEGEVVSAQLLVATASVVDMHPLRAALRAALDVQAPNS